MSEAKAMSEARLTEVEAIRLVTLMVADKADASADRSYIKALAGYLMAQPRAVAIACCDPHRGLATEVFARIVIADIARWCARESEPIAKVLRDDALRRWFGPPDGEMSREGRETVAELRARLGPTFGLKGIDKLDRIRGETRNDDPSTKAQDEAAAKARHAEETRRVAEASARMIAADYARRGMEPISTGGAWNLAVSAALAAQLRPAPAKARKKRRAV